MHALSLVIFKLCNMWVVGICHVILGAVMVSMFQN
jgi:hypothetical protein